MGEDIRSIAETDFGFLQGSKTQGRERFLSRWRTPEFGRLFSEHRGRIYKEEECTFTAVSNWCWVSSTNCKRGMYCLTKVFLCVLVSCSTNTDLNTTKNQFHKGVPYYAAPRDLHILDRVRGLRESLFCTNHCDVNIASIRNHARRSISRFRARISTVNHNTWCCVSLNSNRVRFFSGRHGPVDATSTASGGTVTGRSFPITYIACWRVVQSKERIF